MPSNPNATAIAKKYYRRDKGSIGLNDGRRRRRRRRRRKKPVPRAAGGYARQLKMCPYFQKKPENHVETVQLLV